MVLPEGAVAYMPSFTPLDCVEPDDVNLLLLCYALN